MESYSSCTKVLDSASSNTKELGQDVVLCSCSAAKRRGEIPIFFRPDQCGGILPAPCNSKHGKRRGRGAEIPHGMQPPIWH